MADFGSSHFNSVVYNYRAESRLIASSINLWQLPRKLNLARWLLLRLRLRKEGVQWADEREGIFSIIFPSVTSGPCFLNAQHPVKKFVTYGAQISVLTPSTILAELFDSHMELMFAQGELMMLQDRTIRNFPNEQRFYKFLTLDITNTALEIYLKEVERFYILATHG